MTNKEIVFDFLLKRGFEVDYKAESEYFGDYEIIFLSNMIKIRLSSSKSFETIDISAINDPTNWFDLELIKAYLIGELNLNGQNTLDDLIIFLKSHLRQIEVLFENNNYEKTRIKLDELGLKRSNQLFNL